jgi:hypothetical protein
MEARSPIIEQLLEPTPSGAMKLTSAWDALHTETRMQIFHYFSTDTPPSLPPPLLDGLLNKALRDDNTYVRYLAARLASHYWSSDKAKEAALRERVENDAEPLVRYALFEDWGSSDPAAFFALRQEARLALVRGLAFIYGAEQIATIIQYAIDHQFKDGTLSPLEVRDILIDYLNRPSLREEYGPHSSRQELTTLWKLLPGLPWEIAWVLAKYLPPLRWVDIPLDTESLLAIEEYSLSALLYRDDIRLNDFRQYVFRHRTELSTRLVRAAISSNFDISNDDFHAVLRLPANDRTDLISELSYARKLRLCVFDALADYLEVSEPTLGCDDPDENRALAREHLQDLLRELEADPYDPYHLEEELLRLRLYRMARNFVPVNPEYKEATPPTGELEFLREHIVKGDTWATFMNFSAAFDRKHDTHRLEQYLPSIREATLPASREKESARQDELSTLTNKFSRLEKTIERKLWFIGEVIILSVSFAVFLHIASVLPQEWSISKEASSWAAVVLGGCSYSFLRWRFHRNT